MLSRAIGRRLAIDAHRKLSADGAVAPPSSLVIPILTRLLLTSSVSNSLARYPSSYRTFATTHSPRATAATTSPKKASGAGSTPKTKAKKPTTRKKAKPAAKKKKKVAAKKKKPAARKKKPAAKKKRPASKRAKTVKKPLSTHVILSRKAHEARKEALLDGPKMLPNRSFAVLATQEGGGRQRMKECATRYRQMSTGERQQYADQAHQNHIANKRTMDSWLASHTPDQIRLANNARRRLNALRKQSIAEGGRAVSKQIPTLKDDRLIKKPNSPYLQFSIERRASGDFVGVPIGESSKVIAKEWKALNPAERKKYVDEYQPLKERHEAEIAALYPRMVSPKKAKTTKTT